MKNPIEHFNKVFDSRVRMGIMSSLMVAPEMSFNELRGLIRATDGNLASHLKSLENHQYITVQKGFIGRKTNTVYAATRTGRKAFQQHLAALEDMIRSMR